MGSVHSTQFTSQPVVRQKWGTGEEAGNKQVNENIMPEPEPGVFGKMRRRSLSCVAQRFAVLLIVWYVGGSTRGRSNIKKLRGSLRLLSKQSHAHVGQ